MKTITESEAQWLANCFRSWVAANKDGIVYAYKNRPHIKNQIWKPSNARNPCTHLPVRIASDRPWTEQIWGPE